MHPADRDRSLLAAPPGLPPRARERRRRQRRERLPVLSEQLGLGRAESVVALALAQVEAVLEQPAVERADVAERRDGDEEVPPVAADLVLDAALLVARVGIGEGVVESVVGREAAEELRCPHLPADAPADLGGVVEDRPPGRAADELEDVAEPLADALGRLAPEDPGEPDVGVREGDRQVLAPGDHAAGPEVRLAEVDLDLAGQPSRRQESLGVPAVALAGRLLAAAPDVALHGGVAARVALLVAKTHVDPRRRVALLAPVPAVVVEPGVDRLLVWREGLALVLAAPRGLGRQVLHPGVLPDRRLRRADRPRNRGDRLAAPCPLAYILYLVHADHSSLALLTS